MFLGYYIYYCISVPLLVLVCLSCILGYLYSACFLFKRQRSPSKENLREVIETSRDAGQGARLRRATLPWLAYVWIGWDAAAQWIFPSHQSGDSQSIMAQSNDSKRVTCKRTHQTNQDLRELLVSLYQQEVQKQQHSAPSLKEAISSLDKYPLPVSSGSDCLVLKGFDLTLCRYIDLFFKNQTSRNNNKINKVYDSQDKMDLNRYSPVIKKSDSKNNLKENSKLETNTEKCMLHSKSIMAQHYYQSTGNNVGLNVISTDSDATSVKSEPNNNTDTSLFIDGNPEPVVLDTNFVKKIQKTSKSIDNKDEQHNLFKFDLFENWESFATNDQKTRNECEDRMKISKIVEYNEKKKKLFQNLDENSDIKRNSTSDDELNNHVCLHNKKIGCCNSCDTIVIAANAYLRNLKKKTESDGEKIDKSTTNSEIDKPKTESKSDGEKMENIGKCANKIHKPPYRSSSYAILIALLEQLNNCVYRDHLTQDELIQKAQRHTDESFFNPKPKSDYTAWISTKRLINKGLIEIVKGPNKCERYYTLTALGRVVAMELLKENTQIVTVNDVIFHGEKNDRVPSCPVHEDIILVPSPSVVPQNEEQTTVCFIEMPPGTFEIIMLIDKRENVDQSLKPKSNCKFELRSLNIGDFLWIARSKKTGQELVLPYIVERKRMDDLASSITDGRFHEQKFRLRKCGLENIIYIIESDNNKHGAYSLPLPTLMQAVTNTSVLEEFNIIRTESWNHTFTFLESLTEKIIQEYLESCLKGCNRDTNSKELMTFEFFNKFSYKNKPLTVRDTFIKMLLQLRGLSVEKALAITDKYSTPRLLMKAYEKCTTASQREMLLSNLKFNGFTQRVGPAISKTVCLLFSKGIQNH